MHCMALEGDRELCRVPRSMVKWVCSTDGGGFPLSIPRLDDAVRAPGHTLTSSFVPCTVL